MRKKLNNFMRSATVMLSLVSGINADIPSRKFDELAGLTWKEVVVRLDNYIIQMQNEPGHHSVVVIHGTRRHQGRDTAKWAACIYKYLVNDGHITSDRIAIRRGETRDTIVIELWISVRRTLSDPWLHSIELDRRAIRKRGCAL